MNRIFDTHTHYDDEAFDADRNELLLEMLSSEVSGFVAMGCNIERSNLAVQLASTYEKVFAAVGIHPQDVEQLPYNYLEILQDMTRKQKVVAIGEIGLDYHYEGFNKELQIRIFKEQIELANELALPVVIHSRDSTADTLAVLDTCPPKSAVIHCFSGSPETAKILVEKGYYIGFTGAITFKNAKKAVLSCAAVPLERLLLETDCPYMAPAPNRGKRCDSRMIKFTADKIAEIKDVSVESLIEICNNNANKFFGLANYNIMC